MRKIGYQIGSTVAGAAAGVTLVPLIENVMPGTVPYIDTILPGNWAKNEVFYPLVFGGISVGAGILLDKEYSNFLLGLGSTAIVSSILKAVLTPGVPARARARLVSPATRARLAQAVRARAPQRAVAPPGYLSPGSRGIIDEPTGLKSPPTVLLA